MAMGWQEVVLYGVFVIGTAMSLFAFFHGRRMRQGGAIPNALREDPAFASFFDDGPCVAGEAEVDAPGAEVVLKCLSLLLENPMNYMQSAWAKMGAGSGQIHLDCSRENEISFTADGMNIAAGLVRAQTGQSGRTVCVRWALKLTGGDTLITIGQLWALLLGLPASVIVPILLFKYVLTSPSPAVRAQTFQTLQVVQVLWEPYLFFAIVSQRRRSAGRYLEMLIASAAFEVRTGKPAILNVGNVPHSFKQ